jgi:hypothetical protein
VFVSRHVETAAFEDFGDRTKDGLLAHGAETGVNESYARLELLARLVSN